MNEIQQLWILYWLLLVATFVSFILKEDKDYGLTLFAFMGIVAILLYKSSKEAGRNENFAKEINILSKL